MFGRMFPSLQAQRDAVVAELAPLMSKKKSKGRVFVMIASSNGISLRAVGFAKVDFEPGNYSPKVVEAFNYIAKDMKREKPNGRIAIFQGVPGTGKTYLIRSLVGAVENAMFIVMPASMVGSLDGPEFVDTLYKTYSKSDGPLVLIIEDADSVLAPRAGDNMHSISSLLNLSDGILGVLMDIRIVATTNAQVDELDEAIKRPGRLSRCVVVDALPYATANSVYHRIRSEYAAKKLPEGTSEADTQLAWVATGLPLDLPPAETYTLAEVYQLARPEVSDRGEVPEKASMGFGD
jgi:SpoVK/Ycf46/Vps4 family AAA+-type ATPase